VTRRLTLYQRDVLKKLASGWRIARSFGSHDLQEPDSRQPGRFWRAGTIARPSVDAIRHLLDESPAEGETPQDAALFTLKPGAKW
jgi:hypothetical protein